MSEGSVAIRLKGYMDSTGLSSSQFADSCGIPRPSLSQLLSGRNKKISDVLVGQIHNAFPELSVLWLLFGEGPMLISAPDNENGESDHSNGIEAEDSSEAPRFVSSSRIRPDSYDNEHFGSLALPNLIEEKDRRIDDLRLEIDKLKKRPRRVSQITVYYDDSTFETFYPVSALTKSKGAN